MKFEIRTAIFCINIKEGASTMNDELDFSIT